MIYSPVILRSGSRGSILLGSMLLISVILDPLFAYASTPGATSTALAGGGRSAIDGNESYLINPASLAHFDGASMTLSTYLYQVPSQSYDAKAWRFSMAENSPLNEVPLAMSYAKSSDLKSQQSDFWLSAGDFVSPYVSVGLSYHYSEWKNLIRDSSLLYRSTPRQLISEHNMSLGVLVTPTPQFGFSFVAQDFIKQENKKIVELSGPDTNSTIKAPISDLQLGIGAVCLLDTFLRIHADLMSNESLIYKHYGQISIGLENMVSEWILTRWGFSHSSFAYPDSAELSQNAMAFGIGFIGPRFEVFLASKQNTGFQNSREHSVDFHIPF